MGHGEASTYYTYDGDALIAEYDHYTGNVLRGFIHGPGVDDPVAARAFAAPPAPRSRSRYEGAGTAAGDRRFLHADERGSIVAVTDNAGATIGINSYDDWGIPAWDPQAGVLNIGRFQYTGQQYLEEIGLYYYKARLYSPTLGRFMQTDPIGYEDGMNMYAYVGNDPVNLSDPLGLFENRNCEMQAFCSSAEFGPNESPGGLVSGQDRPQQFFSDEPGDAGGNGRALDSVVTDGLEMASNTIDQIQVRMREMRGLGRTGEEVVARSLIADGLEIVGRQVYVRDDEGNLRIVDFIVRGGPNRLMGVEAKYGNATRSVRQRTIDTRIRLLGGRIVSRNQPNFVYGQRVRFSTIEMNVTLVGGP